MSKNPLVTIVILSYYSKDTIMVALDSVLAQTYDNIEMIVCDDGSDCFNLEELSQYVQTHKSKNIVSVDYIINSTNLGTVKTVNLALSKSKGEILFLLAADDCFFSDDTIQKWTNEFSSTKSLISTAKRANFNQNLSEITTIEPTQTEIDLIVSSAPKELFRRLAGYNIILGCNTAYKISLFDLLGLFNENYRLIEDYPLVLKALRNDIEISFYDEVVVKHRVGGVSSYGRIDKKYLKEANAIFDNEILPYVLDKRRAKTEYTKWKKYALFVREKIALYNIKEESKFKFFVFGILLVLKHPIRSLKKAIKALFHKKR